MSRYEQRAWESAVEHLNRERESRVRAVTGRVTDPVKAMASRAWESVPAHEGMEQQVLKALGGFKTVTFDPAMRSVNASKRLKRHGVVSAEELLAFDLQQLDRGLPALRTLYAGIAVVEGGGSALAVTGAEVATTVSGGVTAGVAAAAIAADAVTSMALMGRIIGQVAAEYGYDVRLPEEETFALGVISLGTASTAAEKAAALASIRRLTTRMMRQATWAELNQSALVKLINQVFVRLGERLTKRKLAQAVPVAGVLINAGLSAHMADSTYRTARDVYRLRFLTDKYGIDPRTWQPDDQGASFESDVLGAALAEAEAELDGATRTEEQGDD